MVNGVEWEREVKRIGSEGDWELGCKGGEVDLMELIKGVELELGIGRGWEVKGVGNGDTEVGKWKD